MLKMKKNKAYKFRIYPNNQQKEFFNQMFGACRFIYNKMLEDKINYYKQEKKTLNNTPAQYKQDNSWLKELDSYAFCNEQMNLQRAFNNFFRSPGKIGFPKFKSKKLDKNSYTTSNVNNVIKIVDSKHIKLPKIKSLKIKLHRQIPDNYKIKSATIELKPSGKYYISILTEYESQIPQIELNINKSLGLDYSSHDFYADSEGNFANYPKYYRQMQSKLAKEQRKLSRKKLDSNNRNKQRIRIAKIYEKIANMRGDFQHKLSKELSNKYDYIFIEDLNMQNMSRSLRLGKSTLDNAFGQFRILLQYKMEGQGKQLVKIDKWQPTSIICSECGSYHKDVVNSLSVREWVCPDCNTTHNRDINAAKSVKKAGIQLILNQ